MVRERGSGVTPPRVVDLLTKEVSKKSMLAVSKATGIGLAAIGRYLKGVGEPTTKTLKRLADYFEVSVTWLRGEYPWTFEEERKSSALGEDIAKLVHEILPDVVELNPGFSETELKIELLKRIITPMGKVPESEYKNLSILANGCVKYPALGLAFMAIHPDNWNDALCFLRTLKDSSYNSEYYSLMKNNISITPPPAATE